MTAVADALDVLEACVDGVVGAELPGSAAELVAVLERLERLTCRLPAVGHRVLAALTAAGTPEQLGHARWRDVLADRLRLSRAEARRRLDDVTRLAPRTALTGEPLEPQLAATAAAQAAGDLSPGHVAVITATLDRLPHWADAVLHRQVEADLLRAAIDLAPDTLRRVAEHLLVLLDDDGPVPDDRERARRRGITLGRQRPDGMTPLTGLLDPELRASLDAVLATWAAPGMADPGDATPRTSGTPTEAQVAADTRTGAQRTHDAVTLLCRSALASGELGDHNGLPVTVVVSTTLTELESGLGTAVTAGGTALPMSDVLRMAAHAHHYLAVYDTHSSVPLYLARSRRIASPGQRLVLYARDRGCTFPGCTVPAQHCQVHHTTGWARGGHTDIDNEVLTCGPHNRHADNGWTVRTRPDGSVTWTAPGAMRPRTNHVHHPARALRPAAAPARGSPHGPPDGPAP